LRSRPLLLFRLSDAAAPAPGPGPAATVIAVHAAVAVASAVAASKLYLEAVHLIQVDAPE
jgi:hypothetical protein